MPTIFQTKDRNGVPHRNWRFKYIDYLGNRRTATGLPTKEETKKFANKLQTEQDQIRNGMRPAPKERDVPRFFASVVDEYLAWGKSQGGHGGRSWSNHHLVIRTRHLKFWQERLALTYLSDLDGILSQVEAVLRELQNAGRAGKTLQNYAEALAALCDWAIDRDYLVEDPLKKLQKFDTTPKTIRRALTSDEMIHFLAAAPDDYRLLLEVALCTGMRANELRNLRRRHLEPAANGLRLEAGWTKGRKAVFQPIHPRLMQKLVDVSSGKASDEPLLKFPKNAARMVYRILEAAGIPKVTAEGKIDFHALRTSYTTFVFEAGASVKEAQSLARHSTPDLTANVYARTRSDRLSELARAVGDRICGVNGPCPTGVQQPPVSMAATAANASEAQTCSNLTAAMAEGSNPNRLEDASRTLGGQDGQQLGQPQEVGHSAMVESRTAPETAADDFGQRRCPTDVQQKILAASGVFGFSVLPSADWPSFSAKAA